MNPSQLPQKGFYTHYKHDPAGFKFNFTYEMIGIGKDSETDVLSVIYKPMYDIADNGWVRPAEYIVRPLELFMGTLEKDGQTIPRFTRIIDSDLIAELNEAKQKNKTGLFL